MFNCISMSGSDWTQWPPYVLEACCSSLESLNRDGCLCASWLYTIDTTGYDFEDTKLLVRISNEACMSPVRCVAPPAPLPPPPSPPSPSPPRPPILPDGPPPPNTPHQPPHPPPAPQPRGTSIEAPGPNTPPSQPLFPPPQPSSRILLSPPPPSIPGSASPSEVQQPDEDKEDEGLVGTTSYLIRMKVTILLDDSWKSSLSSSPAGGDRNERETTNHNESLPFPDGVIADSIAAMSRAPVSPSEVTIINATVIADTATVHVWVSVPVRNRPDAEHLIGISPPEVRQHLLAAGIQGIQWAGLSDHELPEALSSDEAAVNQVPLVFFGSAFVASIAFVGSLAALDALRSSVGWCMGRRSDPVHSELLLPPMAVASLAAFVSYTVKSLSTSSSGIVVAAAWLPVAAFSCLGATLLFNACAMSLLVISWEQPKMKIYVTDDNSSGGNVVQQSPTASSRAMLLRDDQQQGDADASQHQHRHSSTHPNRWIFCIAAMAAMANVGCLKITTCGVADWCSFPESRRRKSVLSALGLVASLVGDMVYITIIVLDQQNLHHQAAADGRLWSVLPRAAVVLSGNVILLSVMSVVRSLVQQKQKDRRQLLECGNGSSAGCDTPTEIFISPFQSQCSSPAAPVAEGRRASAPPSPTVELGRAGGLIGPVGMSPLCCASIYHTVHGCMQFMHVVHIQHLICFCLYHHEP